ncbi:MAG: acyl-CoA thioesterase [Granulosicoccus sp.]
MSASSAEFSLVQKVLFKHCDPAGIVFYPRYFEMINDTVEAFFEEFLHYSYREVIIGNGAPTAQISATFSAPSRLGDMLNIGLKLTALGNSSMNLAFETRCNGELRFSAQSVLVYIDSNGKPTQWPDRVRQKLSPQLSGEKK